MKKLQNAECRLQYVIYVSDAERTWNLLLVRTMPKQFLKVCFSECFLWKWYFELFLSRTCYWVQQKYWIILQNYANPHQTPFLSNFFICKGSNQEEVARNLRYLLFHIILIFKVILQKLFWCSKNKVIILVAL